MPFCQNCNKPIRWKRTKRNRWQPVNGDGEPHFATCSQDRRAAALANAPLTSPGIRTQGIPTKLYRGDVPPWEFPTWEWIEPSDELRYAEWMRENGCHDDLFGDNLDERFAQIMQDDAA